MAIKLATEPKYKTLYSKLKKEHDNLKIENQLLRDKVYDLSNMVLSGKVGEVIVEDGMQPISVPKHVAEWMVEFGLPWQVFKCDEHGLWFDELDYSFPYHMELCACCKC